MPTNKIKDMRGRIAENDQFVAELFPPFPNKILIELTNACNSKCVFCANRLMTRKKGCIKKDFFNKIVREAYSLGAREIALHATGEPFLVKSLSEYIRLTKEIGFEYAYVTTNGVLATPERIVPVLEAGLDSIKFSINAGTRQTYARIHGSDDFETVLHNLRFIDQQKKKTGKPSRVYVSFVVTKYNQHERELFKDLVSTLADDIVFYNVSNPGGIMNEIVQKLNVDGEGIVPATKLPCGLLFNRIHITWEGYVTACCLDYQNYLVVADLKDSSLRDAWHNAKFVDIRKRHLEDRLEGTLCYNCIYGKSSFVEPLMAEYATFYDEKVFSGSGEDSCCEGENK